MANSVVDKLTDWQNDADSLDTNLPTNVTNMGDNQPGDLDGEFRRVKSEMRDMSLAMSWERWKGLTNLASTGPIAFTYVSAQVFTVNDNFTATNRNVAIVGRRVKALLTGSTLYGTIKSATFSTPDTTITCQWDSGSLDVTLSEIQFGPEPRAYGSEYFLEKQTAVSTGQIDLTTGFASGFTSLHVKLINLVPFIDNTYLVVRLSVGGTFQTGATAYSWIRMGGDITAGPTAQLLAAELDNGVVFASGLGASAGEYLQGELTIYSPATVGPAKQLIWKTSYINEAGRLALLVGNAFLRNGSAVDGIRFQMSLGAILSGDFILTGTK